MADYIDAVFTNLDLWRHLPSYQLERRADAFFAAYLPDVLAAHYKSRPDKIIPEFPIHIPTIHRKVKANLSFKIDYLAVFTAPAQYVFIELKTDSSSRRSKQDWYLRKAVEAGLPKLLKGLQRIYRATAAKAKYDVLFSQLHSAKLIISRGKGEFDIVARDLPPQLLYIQPRPPTDATPTVEFSDIADLLSHNEDPLSQRFARSLREWAAVDPGKPLPAA